MPSDAPSPPRTHMVLRAVVEGRPWLVDVGFGGNVPMGPCHHLNVARTSGEARYARKNARLTIRASTGEQNQRTLGVEELVQTLRDIFSLPVEESWFIMLERAVAAGREAG